MPEGFDPYRKWLGIPLAEQPPNHYRLLGVGPFEDDPDVIESAADQRMSHLRTFQAGAHSAFSQQLLNEVAAAKLCLLASDTKSAYDAQLRRQLEGAQGERRLASAKVLTVPAAFSAEAASDSQSPVLIVDHKEVRARNTTRSVARQHGIMWLGLSAVGVLVFGVIAYTVFRPDAPSVKATSPTAVAAPPKKPERKTAPQSKKQTGSIAENSPSKAAPTSAKTSHPAGPPRAVAPFDAARARALQEAWASHLKVPVEQTNSVGMRLVVLPPGEFMMGSTPEQIADAKSLNEPNGDPWHVNRLPIEAPAHRVAITRPFLIGATEATIGQYRHFVDATGYLTEAERFGGGDSSKREEDDPQRKSHTWRSPGYPASEDSAVGQVTWNDAVAFCNWLSETERRTACYGRDPNGEFVLSPEGDGYRLPTEAEWEYACRAGSTTQFPFGDGPSALDEYAWCNRTGPVPHPHAVRMKKPNPFGLYDLPGNMEEWCHDWFSANYYAESPASDPTGPVRAPSRVMRGGAWDSPVLSCRSAFRRDYAPFWRFGHLGFRVVRVSVALPNRTPRS